MRILNLQYNKSACYALASLGYVRVRSNELNVPMKYVRNSYLGKCVRIQIPYFLFEFSLAFGIVQKEYGTFEF